MVKFALTGLTAGTTYTYRVKLDGKLGGLVGQFKTLPAASGAAASFTVAFAGDAQSGSTHKSFHTVRGFNPLMFVHLGDLHYDNNATNSAALFHTSYDTVLRSAAQHRLYREVATAYVWDDHDYGINNADGTSVTKPAAASAYRSRVPHYSLPHATAIYQTWDIGRVRFIITDQRSEASPKANTDNSSKSMLGTTQKTWFKNLLSNSAGYAIVWICPRGFGGAGAVAGADWWQGFTTERTELADHIKANCHGRVMVLCADLHGLGIDNGTNYDFATGGGEPLPTFQAAALDQPGASTGFTYSQGEFTNQGQFGTMDVVDTGGATISVTWKGWDSTGALLTTLAFTVTP